MAVRFGPQLRPVKPRPVIAAIESYLAAKVRFLGGCWLGLGLGLSLAANGTINPCTEAGLDAALIAGGHITFACNGTIPVQSTKVISIDTTLDASGRQVTLSGAQSNRLFIINPGVTLTLLGLTLTGGKDEGGPGRTGTSGAHGGSGEVGHGGAILNFGALIAVNTRFTTNNATGGDGGDGSPGSFFGVNGRDGGSAGNAWGGAIDNDGGTLHLTNCTFIGNSAVGGFGGNGGSGGSGALNGDGGDAGDGGSALGGAIANRNGGLLHLVNCTFSSNATSGQQGGEGGFAGGGITFDGRDGRAGSALGGALHLQQTRGVILNSTFDLNQTQGADGLHALGGRRSEPGHDGGSGAAGQGGAIAITGGSLALTNSTLFANRVTGGDGGEGGQGGSQGFGGNGGDGGDGGLADGGGIVIAGGAIVEFVNCTLANNTVSGGQGGIGGNAGTFVTRRGNSGSPGPALGANVSAVGGEARLLNVLLANGAGGDNSAGVISDRGHNLSSDSTPAFNHPASRNELDPLLGAFAEHGGPTRTVALQMSSAAVDAAAVTSAPPLDQRGFVRVGLPDIGAYEWAGSSPGLTIRWISDVLVLSWPLALTEHRLQTSRSLNPPAWEEAPPPDVLDFQYVVPISFDGAHRFYRLLP